MTTDTYAFGSASELESLAARLKARVAKYDLPYLFLSVLPRFRRLQRVRDAYLNRQRAVEALLRDMKSSGLEAGEVFRARAADYEMRRTCAMFTTGSVSGDRRAVDELKAYAARLEQTLDVCRMLRPGWLMPA